MTSDAIDELNSFQDVLLALIHCKMEVVKEGDADANDENVNAGDATEGDVSAAHDEVSTVAEEPSISSPTPPTPPPQPSHDIPSTSQVGTTQRVETSDETVMDDVSNQGRMIAKMDQNADVVLEDDKEEAKEVNEDNKEDESEPVEVQEVVDVVTTAKIITEVVTATSETITAASETITAAEAQVPAVTLTAALLRVTDAPSRRRKGVVIRDPQEESTCRELEAELNKNIDWDEAINHVKKKAKEDPTLKRYQVLKRKSQTEAQARKNMMVYLKNVVGFKMDYFKGMSYDDIRLIFEAKFNTNMAFLQKTKEQIEEEDIRALKRLSETSGGRRA
nr:hypothetical protein [Tanacetum cinerariifolium]